MDRAADLLAEDAIDESVLLDPGEPGKRGGAHDRPEVVAASGVVLDVHFGAGDGCLDALLDLCGAGHMFSKLSRPGRYTFPMVTITDKGADKVREFLASQSADVTAAGLRVGVRGGGCSGFQYQLAFDEKRDDDQVFEVKGLKLLVDHDALSYVDGSEIDYVDALIGAGFKVNNPNVVAACGCGSSFRVAGTESCSPV
jgi:iron-sulfur cluster assembly protein